MSILTAEGSIFPDEGNSDLVSNSQVPGSALEQVLPMRYVI